MGNSIGIAFANAADQRFAFKNSVDNITERTKKFPVGKTPVCFSSSLELTICHVGTHEHKRHACDSSSAETGMGWAAGISDHRTACSAPEPSVVPPRLD